MLEYFKLFISDKIASSIIKYTSKHVCEKEICRSLQAKTTKYT